MHVAMVRQWECLLTVHSTPAQVGQPLVRRQPRGVIATEAGARVSDHHGRPWAFNRPDPRQASLVCAAPVIQPMIVRRCKNVPLST